MGCCFHCTRLVVPVHTPNPVALPRRAICISTSGSSPTTPTSLIFTPSWRATKRSACSEGLPVMIAGALVMRRTAPVMA